MPSTDQLRTNTGVQHEIYDTFSSLLEAPAGGHVLFYPEKGQSGGGTVGDGGYIDKGCFRKEFNVYSSPLEGTTALTLSPNGLDTNIRTNSHHPLRSSTSLAVNFKASVEANAVPIIPTDASPLTIIPEVSIDVKEDKFAFMAFCGDRREVKTLRPSQRRKIVEWFFQNEDAIKAHCEVSNIVFVTETVRSAGWVGGVAIKQSHNLSGQVTAGAQVLDVFVKGSTARANNIGLVPTQGPPPDTTIPWSQYAVPDYTVVMNYIMITWKVRFRHVVSNLLRVRSQGPQDSSELSRKESTSNSGQTRTPQQQGPDPSSSSSAGHLQALLSQAPSMGVNNVALDVHADADADAAADDDDVHDEDNENDDEFVGRIDDTLLSRLLARALRESGADVAVGDRAIINDYVNRYGVVPDVTSVVLRLEVKDHGNGRTAVQVLSIARDANEPEQPEESAPAVLAVGQEGSGAAAPPLKPLFAALEIIHARCTGVQQNKKQCQVLYEFCNTIVTAINTNVENGLSLDDKSQSIQQMEQLLYAAADDVLAISTYEKIDAFVTHDAIKDKIYDLRVRLAYCFTVFGITSSLRLQKFADDFAAAAVEDQQVAVKLQLLALAQAELEQRDQRMEGKGQRIEQKLESVLGMRTAFATDATLLTQIKSRMAPAGSAAEADSLAALRAIQIQSRRQLPLGDLVNEAERVGTTAISHSATSELWRGIWLRDPTIPLALKCPHISVPLSPNAVLTFQRSIDSLRCISHRNIMPLLGVKYKPDQSIEFLAFPWIENGNILDYLTKNPDADRVKLMFGVACGLEHLHAQSPPIVHRSVQPCNILVDAEGEAIILDLGIAKAFDDSYPNARNDTISDDPQTSLRWMAPELSDGQYDRPADAYAWAMTTLQVLSGVEPFGNMKQPGRVAMDVQRGKRPRREDHPTPLLTDEMWSLLERCWQHEPSMRATMVDVVNAIMKMRPDLTVH